MKSFILGFSTLLAVATTPVAAQAQAQDPAAYGDQAVMPSPGPEWSGEDPNAYQPAPEAVQQPVDPNAMVQQQASFGFFGPHPIPYDQGGGFCTHSGAHEHPYPVFDRNLFRVVDGYAYFIGDTADFGYQGQAYVYNADHPIDTVYGGGFCYIGWPHRHWFAPPTVGYSWTGASYVYVGGFAPAYYVNRPLYVNYFNNYYRRWYLGGSYYYRRPAPIYGGWGWQRPRYGYGYGYGRPGYVSPPVYRGPVYRGPMYAPGYRAPAPVYRAPVYGQGPVYRAPAYGGGPVYRAPAPVYRAPAYGGQAPTYRAPAPMYHAPAYHAPAPAYHVSAPAFHGGGGGHFSAPSFHGGGGGHFRR